MIWDIGGISMGYLWDIYGISKEQLKTGVKDMPDTSQLCKPQNQTIKPQNVRSTFECFLTSLKKQNLRN